MKKTIRERAIPWLIKRPFLYDLTGVFLRRYCAKAENPAFKNWVSFLLQTHKEAFARRKPVIWSSAFVPTELIHGLECVPVHPELLAALMTFFNISGWFLEHADTRVSTDVCSFHRIALGMAVTECIPKPDLLISSSTICDGSNKFFGYLSEFYGVPHYFIDVPYENGKEAQRYLTDQLQNLIDASTRLTGTPWKHERMDRVVDLSNQARDYLLEINRLRKTRPAPFSGSEALSYGAGMLFSSLGTQQAVDFFESLCQFIRQKTENGKGYLPEERHRLLWLHHIRPYYPNSIFDVLNRGGAAVVFEEVSHVYWPPLENKRLLESLSEKLLSNPSNGPLERRVDNALRLAKTYEVNGVIHFSHWGCRQSCGGAGVMADVLKEQGVPCLILDGDGGDPSNYSPGQTQTRLEAFLEMLS